MKLKSAKEFSLFAKIMRLLVPAALICTALFNVPVFGQIKKARVLVDYMRTKAIWIQKKLMMDCIRKLIILSKGNSWGLYS